MRIVTPVWVLLLTVGALSCTSWTAPDPAPTPADAGPIRIGVVTPISGSLARFGQAHLQGYDIALQKINGAGGVLGRRLKLIFEDDESTPEQAAAAVEKLAGEDQVPLISGQQRGSRGCPRDTPRAGGHTLPFGKGVVIHKQL